ncbi:DNA polymerase III subunit delta [Lacticaseibacillus zhaodongensis]|uniref:DNA polymerase III subunit delta n=1 Tax=Lacticaseibacillus zhaodongensis TaxID=2668065 RepID=UPI0012D2A780|nr:DNA polymerase III subunit delta [Lacticaseibacillus zhaodongensis]
MDLAQLQTELKKGQIRPVYLLQGGEAAVITQARALLRQLIPSEEQSMNYAQYDLHEVGLATAVGEIGEAPFFGDYREVVIDNADFLGSGAINAKQEEAVAELQAYLQDPLSSTILVLIAPNGKIDARKKIVKAVKKAAFVLDASPLKEGAAQAAIRRELQTDGIEIDSGGMRALFSRTQGDYSAMVAALPVLKLYAYSAGKLSEADVLRLVPKELNDSVFDLVNAVMRRDVTAALAQYRELLAQQEEPLRLISLLEGQFRLLIQVEIFMQRGYTQGAVAESLSVHPYRVKLAWGEVRKLRRADLEAAFIMLVNTEAAMKRGTLSKTLGFELFVLQFAGQGKDYSGVRNG